MKLNNFIFIGIDPGITGAIAFYKPDRYRQVCNEEAYGRSPALDFLLGERLTVFDMPTRQRSNGRRELHQHVLASYVERYVSRFKAIAAIEKVAAMTGREDAASMFQFGRSFGIPLGILAANQITVFETPPAVWKAKFGLGRDKKESLIMARQRFPKHRRYFERVKDNGRAEAALIAQWAYMAWGLDNENFVEEEDDIDPFEGV